MKILIETIPHYDQRYDTCGDWQFNAEGNLHIKVSEMGDWRFNFLIARHELDEAMLCKLHNITQEQVDEYDNKHPNEAGSDDFSDNFDALYYNQHCDALAAEWIMSRLLYVDWKEYTKKLEKLGD